MCALHRQLTGNSNVIMSHFMHCTMHMANSEKRCYKICYMQQTVYKNSRSSGKGTI